jgi:hypothetical protein
MVRKVFVNPDFWILELSLLFILLKLGLLHNRREAVIDVATGKKACGAGPAG